MGNDSGHRSVVDSTLRVHGVKGLSVCDASVMPNIVSANTNATSMMIGVAGAALVQRRLLNKSNHGNHGNHGNHKRRKRNRSRPYSTTTLTSASAAATPVSLGFDFGTESCRACLVDVASGNVVGDGTWKYASGQITGLFPGWVDSSNSSNRSNTSNRSKGETHAGRRPTASPKEMASHVVLQDSNDWWLSAKEALNLAFQNSTVRPTCRNLLLPSFLRVPWLVFVVDPTNCFNHDCFNHIPTDPPNTASGGGDWFLFHSVYTIALFERRVAPTAHCASIQTTPSCVAQIMEIPSDSECTVFDAIGTRTPSK